MLLPSRILLHSLIINQLKSCLYTNHFPLSQVPNKISDRLFDTQPNLQPKWAFSFSLSILPFNTRHLLEIGISFCQHGICFFQSEILHSFNFPKRNFFYSYFMLPKIWKICVYEPISKFF